MENIKSKVSLKGLETVEDILPMIRTLTKQYGLWTDQDYKSILTEIDEASNVGYDAVIETFNKYYKDYVVFTKGV
tara:strand:- start:363 stop:587 length:225 start_codon:yes stop_codon:yes gene_type:complete